MADAPVCLLGETVALLITFKKQPVYIVPQTKEKDRMDLAEPGYKDKDKEEEDF
jgi:hypothetical protein